MVSVESQHLRLSRQGFPIRGQNLLRNYWSASQNNQQLRMRPFEATILTDSSFDQGFTVATGATSVALENVYYRGSD